MQMHMIQCKCKCKGFNANANADENANANDLIQICQYMNKCAEQTGYNVQWFCFHTVKTSQFCLTKRLHMLI